MRCIRGSLIRSQRPKVRSRFSGGACHLYGHPSSGGILIKRSADLVDLQFLSLPRLVASERSLNSEEEDAFCGLLRCIGATWWEDEDMFLRALEGEARDDSPFLEGEEGSVVQAVNEARARKVVTFAWPSDGKGVWILRLCGMADRKMLPEYRKPPTHYGKMNFAISMEERIVVMREFGADFVEDLSLVKELHEPWSPDAYEYYLTEEIRAAFSDSSSSSSYSITLSDMES